MDTKLKNYSFLLDVIFNSALLKGYKDEEKIHRINANFENTYQKDYLMIQSICKEIIEKEKEKYQPVINSDILKPFLTNIFDFAALINDIKDLSLTSPLNKRLPMWKGIEKNLILLKNHIRELIQKNIYDIKIEINVNENPKLELFKDKYQIAINLYLNKTYAKAIQHARDVFQEDLKSNFNKHIKLFENFKKEDMEYNINQILTNISTLRNNHLKTISNEDDKKLKPYAKLIIEQLINIRNFIEMNE